VENANGEFLPFHDKWINRFVRAKDGALLSPADTELLDRDFSETLARHLREAHASLTTPGFRWGWKAPRSIYLLPLFHARYPGMKYIHVIRDGRDMAFSKNQNQLRKNGSAVLSWRERLFTSRAVRSIMLWDRVNLHAAAFCESNLKDNYLVIRFEDLCQKPVESTERILQFMEVSGDAEEIARAEISPPSSLGRWRSQPPKVTEELNRVATRSLQKFGYLSEMAVEPRS
ncbi:MAG: sulfotransferase, partial [Verrucomicrobiaceae bacterium]